MKNLRLLALASSALVAMSAVVVACSSDDTTSGGEEDGGAEATTKHDARPDEDVTTENDAQTDATVDAGSDTGSDTGNDAGGDAAADAPHDVVVIGDSAAATLMNDFLRDLANAQCDAVSRCCWGPTFDGGAVDGGDGGSFDRNTCLSFWRVGVERSNPSPRANPAHLGFDSTTAAECVQRARSTSCTTGSVEFKALRAACYEAIVGLQKAGEPCIKTDECQPNLFCNAGSCAPIRDVGAPCGDWTKDWGDSQFTCSTRYSGAPARFCMNADDAGNETDAGTWTCQADLPTGASCLNNEWCLSGLCGPDRTCVDSKVFQAPSLCSVYVK